MLIRWSASWTVTTWADEGGHVRILVVEDERTLATFIAQGLESEGHTAVVTLDGPSGEQAALTQDVALVILDIGLPGKSGLQVLRTVRGRKTDLPVILLTGRDDVAARVEGLDLGADDYMGKPFSLEELMARVRAQLRGSGQERAAGLCVGELAVDLRTRRVTNAGKEVRLTPREQALLVYLMRHPDQVLSRQQLLQAVWGLDFDPGTKVLEVYVGYLRRKLGSTGTAVPIETLRHIGYRLRAPRG